jgi:hypothetical protein
MNTFHANIEKVLGREIAFVADSVCLLVNKKDA